MADCGGSSRVSNVGVFPPADDPNPLKTLYPMISEEETPLPQCWSTKDKYNYIGLSQNSLRVHYKGEYHLRRFYAMVFVYKKFFNIFP